MGKLIAVKYHNTVYPENINTTIEEIAGHFDVGKIEPKGNYSLHTEYSYGKRNFDKPILERCSSIIKANKDGVPKLWYNSEWASSFARYIEELTKGFPPPTIIEIHPPFRDYVKDMTYFIDVYRYFEEQITYLFPDSKILLENRCGSMYRNSHFLIMKAEDIVSLVEEIEKYKLNLRITLDFPQLFSAHTETLHSEKQMVNVLKEIKSVMHYVNGIHIWGKRRTKNGRSISHVGDLNSYFDYNNQLKQLFLQLMVDLVSDEIDRYLVLEVNSGNEDMQSILSDLIQAGLSFR